MLDTSHCTNCIKSIHHPGNAALLTEIRSYLHSFGFGADVEDSLAMRICELVCTEGQPQ